MAVSAGVCRRLTPIGRSRTIKFIMKRHIASLFFIQLPHMISRNAVEKCRRRSLFLVEFSGMANQRQEGLLDNIRSGFWASGHVQSEAVQTTLVTAIELQKSVLVS